MEEKALEFLRMSKLFSGFVNVNLEIHKMDYPFRSNTIFFKNILKKNRDVAKDFSLCIKSIAKNYMRRWIEENPSDKEKNMDRVWDGLLSFSENFKPEEIFSKISSGKEHFDISIDVNNSVLRVKRFGNCIGIKVLQGGITHETGFKTMLNMCEEENHLVAQFIHRIECSIPMPKKRGKENSEDVNFLEIEDQLHIFCAITEWKPLQEWFPNLIDQYVSINWNTRVQEKGVVIGSQEGIEIHAMIIHSDDSKEPNYRKTPQWRKGNLTVSSEKEISCNFSDGDDLRLVLMAHSGLSKYSNSSENIETDFDVAQSQYCLKLVGAIMFNQLTCMLRSEEMTRVSSYG